MSEWIYENTLAGKVKCRDITVKCCDCEDPIEVEERIVVETGHNNTENRDYICYRCNYKRKCEVYRKAISSIFGDYPKYPETWDKVFNEKKDR